jgi:hypothetical protein
LKHLAVTVEAYAVVKTEAEMVDYVLTTGPLSVCVDASTWFRCVSPGGTRVVVTTVVPLTSFVWGVRVGSVTQEG